jgi:hypothetical protein
VLTVEAARAIQAQKAEQAIEKQLTKEARAASKATSQAQKKLHQAGVKARKEERLRKKKVATLQKARQPIPLEDRHPILDPEAEAEAEARALEYEEEGSRSRSGSRSWSGSGSGSGSDDI